MNFLLVIVLLSKNFIYLLSV